MKQILTTYKTWRTTHNPWQGNNFIGNLNPDNPDDANLIDEIHSYIDEYFNPRILGVTDSDRFLILMHAKLAGIETNFFHSLMLDKNYDNILDMLKNIDMLSDTNTDTNLSGTNNSTVTAKRTDNLKSTKSSRSDSSTGNLTGTQDIGKRDDTTTNTVDGDITTTREYGQDVTDNTTTYGRKSTQGGTTKQTNNNTTTNQGRAVNSQTPQSVVGVSVAGIDSPVDWNYATALQDNKNTQTSNGTNNTEHGLTDTLSGTDETKSTRSARTDSESVTDNRTQTETNNIGAQKNTSSQDSTASYTEGEQSVSNTGTQDNSTTENKEHSQTGKYKKTNDNSGRTDNIAVLWQQWRDLLHKTMSAYTYLFEQLDSLFISIWDIEDDTFFTII